MNVVAAHITPPKLRSGDPDALAALCDRRGAAVFAYCQQAAGPEAAAEAAAEAFAQFRRVIQPKGALADKGAADVLLRSAARRCALVLAGEASAEREADAAGAVAEGCGVQGAALVVYVEDALAPAERDVVAGHVRKCEFCAATLRRLEDAEAGFNVKPGTALPVAVAREILTALVHAAPVNAHGGDATAVRDEALRLLTGDAAAPAPPAPPAPAPVSSQPVQRAAIAAYEPGRLARLRGRLPRLGAERFGPSLPAMLLRGTIRLAAVVLAAVTIGILLGVALSKL